MLRNLYTQFTEWVTQLRVESARDPITRARAITAVVFLAFCTLSFFITGEVLNHYTTQILHEAISNPVPGAEITAIEAIDQIRWTTRTIHLIFIVIAIYILMDVTLRPVRRAVESQRRVIANISHELRTPLTVAKTETEVALRNRDSLSREEAIEVLEGNLAHINHISRIIQFVLLLSDFRTPQSRSLEGPVSLPALIASAYEQFKDSAATKNVVLRTEVGVPDAVVLGNAVALEKMLTNLIRNALAHTPSGGEVVVGLARARGCVVLTVTDTGTGIPENDLPRIFDPFYRASNAVRGGSGLGLSIVKEVADLHKGEVHVKSALGEGSVFGIRFKI